MHEGPIEPMLRSRDWNEEWKTLQTQRRRSDSAETWDARAATFPVKHGSQEGYVADFLKLANIQPGESVFDMGCGTGALATPLAKMGHHVIACDFSRGMLDAMRKDQEKLGIEGVETRVLAWDDDWAEHGIEPNCADVALASRSIATRDLKRALLNLSTVARRKACITLPCGPSPRVDNTLLEACGFPPSIGHDFLYAFVILTNAGFRPEVDYIRNTRVERFDSREDAFKQLSAIVEESVRGIASADALADFGPKLDAWLDDNLVEVEGRLQLKRMRDVLWAFIAWDVN